MTVTTGKDLDLQAATALERGAGRLLALQDSDGWWKGDLETNVSMDAEDLLLREFLGIRTDERTKGAAAWIRSKQREDGTWATFHGGPPDLSTTIEAYVALRLAGAVRAVGLGGPAGHAAGDDPAALVGPAERLRLRLLGAADDRAADDRERAAAGAADRLRPERAARRRRGRAGGADHHLGRPLPAARPLAARLPPPS